MNLQQLKQYLFNNLMHGENGAPRKSRLLALNALVMPDPSRAFGIDVSHWNIPPVDFRYMKELYGLMFVIIKGCDGSLESRYVRDHVAAAKLAGIPWGLYVWLYPDNKVRISAQVAAWVKLADELKPPMGIYIDAEWTTYAGQPANPSAVDLRLAHDQLRAKGYIATTYTAKGYADTYLKGFDWMREELWVASYGGLSLPTGATRYTMHQFTASLNGAQLDPGGNAELDGNYYNGTRADFAIRYGVVEPPPGEPNMPYFKVNTGALNVRSGPGGSYADIGDLLQDDLIVASEIVGGWAHIQDAKRGGWDGTPVKLASGVTVAARVLATNDVWCNASYLVATPGPVPVEKTLTELVIKPAAGSELVYKYSDGSQKVETV